MANSKSLYIDPKKVKKARALAQQITRPVQDQIRERTTVSIERATLRLLGVEGSVSVADEAHGSLAMPIVNPVIDQLSKAGLLHCGILKVIGLLMETHQIDFDEAIRQLGHGQIQLQSDFDVSAALKKSTKQAIVRRAKKAVQNVRKKGLAKQKRHNKVFGNKKPLAYVIVATGNIHEDVLQAQSAAENGADIIAVIRSTAQSLLDYVPEGLTTVGFGGTFATQENFRLMRSALDKTGKELGRYIYLTNYSSGLCMAEIAAIAALEDLDMLLNDAMYGILFRDINMQRTFLDQYFSRLICNSSKIYIQTGEDNYLTTADAFKSGHQVLASQLINESFAKRAKLPESLMCLGHAFEMDPWLKNGFLWEIAQAQMIRQIFPKAPLKYMPPTKHKTGDFFWSNLYDGMFNLCGLLTGQTILLLGMATESLHNPKMHDRYWSLKNAKYILNNASDLRDEIQWKKNGQIRKRANSVLEKTVKLLEKVNRSGLMKGISKGWFADVKRQKDGGKGLAGVAQKSKHYWNPVWQALEGKI